MKGVWARHWPLIAALGVLGAVVAVVFSRCLRADGGRFVYTIDDIYIIMAVARNLVVHGVWGVTPYEFSSSTSTIIWPLMLALCYALGGTSELVPLLLNLVLGGATLLVVYVILRKAGLPQGLQAVVLLAVLFLAPLPAVIFTGMEHTLQIGISILFVYVAAHELAGEKGARTGASPWLWALAAFLPLVRYEELSLVFGACLLFFARRRWVEALGLGLAAAIPPAIYGAISAGHGWYWLPNSVYLKANLPHGTGGQHFLSFFSYWEGWTRTMDVWTTMLALLILLALLVHRQGMVWKESSIMIVLVIIAAGLHLKLARFGNFFRYEAYVIALSLLVFSVGAFDYLSGLQGRKTGRLETMLAGCWLGYLLLVPLSVVAWRGYISLRLTPQASHNIYEEQYQMGLFLRQFYRGAPIAATDIGAVSYLGEPHLEDLWGLGSLDAAKLRVEGALTPQKIDLMTRSKGTKMAILFDGIFYNGNDGSIGNGGLPAQWIRVGRWRSFDNCMGPEDSVFFYAVDSSEERALIAHLRQFAPRLPPEVGQSGKYMQPD
jgi:hypothetical protein